MSSLKKRLLVVVSGLAVALIMGAVSDGPEYGVEQTQDPGSASIYDSGMKIAGHEDDHSGG